MKKIISLILLLVLLTGCNNTPTEVTECINLSEGSEIILESRDGLIVRETSIVTTTLSRLGLNISTYYDYIEQALENFSHINGLKVTFERFDQIVEITIVIDFSRFDYAELSNDLEEVVNKLLNEGYYCRVIE